MYQSKTAETKITELGLSLNINELSRLASIASTKYEDPTVFIFDTESPWINISKQLAQASNLPVEIFQKKSLERFSIGYCSNSLRVFVARMMPNDSEEILEKANAGFVKLLYFYGIGEIPVILSANLAIHKHYMQ